MLNDDKTYFLIDYDRKAALQYARKWALLRNPDYVNFAGAGGDCTNFVSQSVYAGCGIMNFTENFGWYYESIDKRAPAWTGVNEFYNFLTGEGGFYHIPKRDGPFGFVTPLEYAQIGDIIQLGDRQGMFYHTLILSEISDGTIFVCAHSNDALNRPLSSYNAYMVRAIHIVGVSRELI